MAVENTRMSLEEHQNGTEKSTVEWQQKIIRVTVEEHQNGTEKSTIVLFY